uniref:PHD-type domain-containing protein n=1 Tax=Araucaria cunninghamii TaxID=56994 RepID=A0A0D6R552_ARACU
MVQSGPPAAPPSGCLVRCAGCKVTLTVAAGITEFRCPNCKLPQMLPPELRRQGPGVAQGIDPSKLQLHCVSCKSILNVPHGLDRFTCPQCRAEQAVLPKYMAPFPNGGSIPGLPDVPGQFEEVNEVAVDVETEEDEGGIIGETFTDYRPSKLSIGPPHPDPVVETSSLSAVQPPEPTYNLKIAEEMENSRALSCLQLETIIYASQRHHQHLEDGMRAGFFIGDGAGVGKGRTIAGLIWENWQHGRRKAIWLSVSSDLKYDARRDLDDVGAKCVEVHALNKLPYSKLDAKAVGIKEGVIFSTYSSLIASSEKGRSRLQQLVQWCGQEYDGLLVFDECHKAKNLVPETGGQATRTGEAVLEIQVLLQQARVVYCSATGASEPRNMGYMVRLGLWGSGTCFPQFQSFLGALEKRGVGALELVAMDMKARGMYVCRTLSFKGAEFDVVEIPLDPPMMEMYTMATQFWIELRLELMTALASLSEDRHNPRPNLSQLWRLYWASHQRFFRHMCMSAKVPAVVRLAKQALLDGKCVVIGLQSTGEARTEEAVTKYGTELDDFVSGPRELLIKLVEDNYPLPRQPSHMQDEEGTSEYSRKRYSSPSGVYFKGRMRKVARSNKSANDESDTESETESESASEDSDEEYQFCYICNGEETAKKMLCCSSCGNLVHPACLSPPEIELPEGNWLCPVCKKYTEETKEYNAGLWKRYETAKERKDQILEAIRKLELPINPLDDIINQLGGRDSVAEMTGRRGSMVRGPNGKIGYHPRNTKDVSMEMVNMSEKQHFMEGTKLVAVISEAGSAGVSLQADRRANNQKRRVHMTFELPWSADRAIQQLGRTHRSNQACAPEYRLLFTNLGGERRFASIVAKRLETLGALTQGDRRAGPSLSAYNYDSPYGKKALSMMYKAIMEQSDPPVLPPNCTAEEPDKIHEFHCKARAALISVGIIRDPLPDTDKPSGRIYDTDMHDVGRFLNRLLGIRPDMQNWIFEYFSSILDILVHDARKEGEFDSGIVDIKANFIKLHGSPKTVHVDRMSGASTTLFTLQVDRGMAWEAVKGLLLEQNMKNSVNHADDGFYESRREWLGRRHYLLAIECPGSSPRAFKIFRPASGEALREMTLSELRSKYKKIISLEKASVRWKEEFEISAEQCMHGPKCKVGVSCTIGRRVQEFHILGGLILPVWGTVEKSLSKQVRQSHRRLRVVRLETTSENRRIVGLHIPNPAVNSVLEGLYGERNPDS